MPTQTTPPDAARDTEPTECFAVPGQNHIVDVIDPATGLSFYRGDTLEQIQAREPGAVRMLIADWQAARAAAQDTPIAWIATTAERYDEMLDVLPPAMMRGGAFLVGEPVDHHATTGQSRFEAYIALPGGVYAHANRPLRRSELVEQLAKGVTL